MGSSRLAPSGWDSACLRSGSSVTPIGFLATVGLAHLIVKRTRWRYECVGTLDGFLPEDWCGYLIHIISRIRMNPTMAMAIPSIMVRGHPTDRLNRS